MRVCPVHPWLAAAALSVAVVALAACSQAPAAAPATPAAGAATPAAAKATPAAGTAAAAPKAAGPTGTVVFGRGGSTLRLYDPGMVNSSEGGGFMYPAFDSLGWLDSKGELRPALATSWRNTDDLTWVFTLGDWKFHNGRNVTVEDVIGTWDRTRDPANRLIGSASFTNVASYRKVDDKTIELKTRTPFPVLPKIISLIAIMPMQEFNQMGLERFAAQPIGTGPYKVVRADFNNAIEYEAMGADWKTPRGVPNIQKLTFQMILEEGAREAAFRTGQLQAVALTDDVAARLERDGFPITRTAGSATTMVNLNTFDGPTANVAVRQALNHAVDKDTILRQLYQGNGVADGQMVGKNEAVIGYNPNIAAYPYDVNRARQLMAQAGFPNGFRTEITTVPSIASIGNQVGEVLQAYMRAIGVETTINPMDNAAWVAAYSTGPETRRGLYMQVFNYEQTMEVDGAWRWFTSDFTPETGRRWVNAEFDSLYQRAKSTFDPRQRNQIYQQAGLILNREAPVIFLWQRYAPIVLQRNVELTNPGFPDSWVTGVRLK